jgi:hypothetical protein
MAHFTGRRGTAELFFVLAADGAVPEYRLNEWRIFTPHDP